MKSRDPNKDIEIFSVLSTLNLELSTENLGKNLSRLQSCLRLFSPKDNLKRELKKNINTIKSIHSAIGRYDVNILERDLNQAKENINEIFSMFKLKTGVHQIIVKPKPKKQIITCLSDLDQLGKVEIESEINASVNLLTFLKEQCEKEINKGEIITFLRLPLILNAFTQGYQSLPRLGILVQETKFGTLWSNQYIIAVKDSAAYPLASIKKLTEEKYGEPFEFLYEPMKNYNFKGYTFHWGIPKSILTTLGSFKVFSYSLPFESRDISSADKDKVKELREIRLHKEEINELKS